MNRSTTNLRLFEHSALNLAIGLNPSADDAMPTGRGSVEQLPQVSPRGAELIELALGRRLVRPPAEELRAVTEAARGKMIKLHFRDKFRLQWLPFHRPLGAPAARSVGSAAGEAGTAHQRFQL